MLFRKSHQENNDIKKKKWFSRNGSDSANVVNQGKQKFKLKRVLSSYVIKLRRKGEDSGKSQATATKVTNEKKIFPFKFTRKGHTQLIKSFTTNFKKIKTPNFFKKKDLSSVKEPLNDTSSLINKKPWRFFHVPKKFRFKKSGSVITNEAANANVNQGTPNKHLVAKYKPKNIFNAFSKLKFSRKKTVQNSTQAQNIVGDTPTNAKKGFQNRFRLHKFSGFRRKKAGTTKQSINATLQKGSLAKKSKDATLKNKNFFKQLLISRSVINIIERNDVTKTQRFLERAKSIQELKNNKKTTAKTSKSGVTSFLDKYNTKLDKKIAKKIELQKQISELDKAVNIQQNVVLKRSRSHHYNKLAVVPESVKDNSKVGAIVRHNIGTIFSNSKIEKVMFKVSKNKKLKYALKPFVTVSKPIINLRNEKLFKKYKAEYIITLITFFGVIIFFIAFFSYIF